MKATEMLKQIKTLLRARVGLAQMTLEDGETVIEADVLEAGQAVFIVSDDERIPLPVGEYTTADGQTIVVTEEGLISEVKLEVEDLEEEEEMQKEDDKEMLEEEVVVEDVPEEAVEEVAAIVEAVVEVVAPVIEEVKQEVEELKKKFEDQYKDDEDKKEKMSSQKPARKPMKHNPEAKHATVANLYSQSANANTTQNRVFEKLFK
tara:strand:+ start:774 stop:1388 length:615 start_codon:yes stop_codon:yes gene_type:complete